MDEGISEEVKRKLDGYDIRGVLKGYEAGDALISSIIGFLKGKQTEGKRLTGLAVMYYLILESISFHDKVTDVDPSSGPDVIYGDYLGAMYHRAVIDFSEYEASEKIISRYKRICMEIFEKGHAEHDIMRD